MFDCFFSIFSINICHCIPNCWFPWYKWYKMCFRICFFRYFDVTLIDILFIQFIINSKSRVLYISYSYTFDIFFKSETFFCITSCFCGYFILTLFFNHFPSFSRFIHFFSLFWRNLLLCSRCFSHLSGFVWTWQRSLLKDLQIYSCFYYYWYFSKANSPVGRGTGTLGWSCRPLWMRIVAHYKDTHIQHAAAHFLSEQTWSKETRVPPRTEVNWGRHL